VPRGAFEKVVKRICKNYNLETSEINMKKRLSRTKPGRKSKVKHKGTNSPMNGIEAHLLADILRCVALRQPVSCTEGLALANSLIEGTPTQVERMEWKVTHLKNGTHDDSFGTFGWRYWQIFVIGIAI
jgi:hypothetical protein